MIAGVAARPERSAAGVRSWVRHRSRHSQPDCRAASVSRQSGAAIR